MLVSYVRMYAEMYEVFAMIDGYNSCAFASQLKLYRASYLLATFWLPAPGS